MCHHWELFFISQFTQCSLVAVLVTCNGSWNVTSKRVSAWHVSSGFVLTVNTAYRTLHIDFVVLIFCVYQIFLTDTLMLVRVL